MFPDFSEWCDTVLHPEDTHPWNFRTPEFYEEYRLKYALAKLIQPRSILEVGVRFGYAANSFLLAAPTATYLGLDVDEPSWGPYKGVPRLWAETTLRARYHGALISTLSVDTQKAHKYANWVPQIFDMIHIDADHSYRGALHDMQTFWPFCRRVMVVDDTAEIPEVASAVLEFLIHEPTATACGTMVAKRGATLIVRDE